MNSNIWERRESTKDIEDPARQEQKLGVEGEDCYNITKDTDSLILVVQEVGTQRGVSEEELIDVALQEQQLNVVR
jgi:hypothetical protein